MYSIIYTYKKKKKVHYRASRFVYLRKKSQLNELIDSLLEIDAVMSPSKFRKGWVEVVSGYGPELKFVKGSVVKKESKKNFVDFKKMKKKSFKNFYIQKEKRKGI